MMNRNATPVIAAGVVGLVSGLLAVLMQVPAFGVVAGVLALAAAFGAMRIARMLEEQSAVQSLIEDELRKVRSDAEETEGRVNQLESSMADQASALAEREAAFYDDDDTDPLTDAHTGLFSESFFLVALESRVAAARRHLRPVAAVIMQVMDGLPASEPRPADARMVAAAIKETLREADTACRLRNGDFALLLEDTPENGAIWTVERIRRQLMADAASPGANNVLDHGDPADLEPSTESAASGQRSADSLTDATGRPTVWAGVACYPAHAFSPDELLHAASSALQSAQEWRQDRIEVAVPATD